VNRRGLGVHFTIERFSNFVAPPPSGPVYQEAIKRATTQVQPPAKKEKKLKLLILAGFGIVQAVVVLASTVFDFIDILHFP